VNDAEVWISYGYWRMEGMSHSKGFGFREAKIGNRASDGAKRPPKAFIRRAWGPRVLIGVGTSEKKSRRKIKTYTPYCWLGINRAAWRQPFGQFVTPKVENKRQTCCSGELQRLATLHFWVPCHACVGCCIHSKADGIKEPLVSIGR